MEDNEPEFPGIEYINKVYQECKEAERIAREEHKPTFESGRSLLLLVDRLEPINHIFFAEMGARINGELFDIGYGNCEEPHRSYLHYTIPADRFNFEIEIPLWNQFINYHHSSDETCVLYAKRHEIELFVTKESEFLNVFYAEKEDNH